MKKIKSKKAQMENPLIMFAIMIIGLLIVGIVILKVMNSVYTPLYNSFGNMSAQGGTVAQEGLASSLGTAINLWDKVMIFFFMFLVVLLFVSAFFIDAHPLWIILYILSSFFLIIFAPNIIDAVNTMYNQAPGSAFATESLQLDFLNVLRTYFTEIIVGMMIVSGIIIYGKIALFGGGNR